MESMDSIFEIKSINKQGFELYNLVNEKQYKVKSQIKMVNYRRLFARSFLTCKVITIDGDYYLSNIDKIIKPSSAMEAYQLAVAMQMEEPSRLYEDNQEKYNEIKQNIKLLAQKYQEFFMNKEVYTTNEKLKELLDTFNEYVDSGEKSNYEKYTESEEKADVVVKFDEQKGLLTLNKGDKENPEEKEFSVPTILYSSKAFEKLMELSAENPVSQHKSESKIGRNEPCLCGSGKKYKKCCL